MEGSLTVLRRASLRTYGGVDVIMRRLMFWTASIFRQFDFDIRGPQIDPAYVRTDLMYIR